MVRSPVDICLGTSPIQAGKISSSRECCATADRRNHCTRNDRADSRYGHHPSTTVITFCQRLDLIGHGFNALIELPPVTGKIGPTVANEALRTLLDLQVAPPSRD
jgi:hypothetical protein